MKLKPFAFTEKPGNMKRGSAIHGGHCFLGEDHLNSNSHLKMMLLATFTHGDSIH